MTTSTILLLILAFLIAGALAFYQYLFKVQNLTKINWFLAILRFFTVFTGLVLLINPVFSNKSLEVFKTPLTLLVDNSKSIKELNADKTANNVFNKITNNEAIKSKFEIQQFQFDKEFYAKKDLDFKGTQSNIDNAAKNLKQLNKNTKYPVVLITDGNQTIGNDYGFSFQESSNVYPVILGDTTTTLDLKINQLNANKYAFLKNKFPVEVFVQYNGQKNIAANFSISKNGKKVSSQVVNFSKNTKVQSIQVLLEADKIGIQKYQAVISSDIKEKNTYNNVKNFAVEIIDQRKEIALVSDIFHPDLGALKRAIEANEQRKVTILKPNELLDLTKYNLLILYQPNNNFRKIFEQNKSTNLNTLVITGMNTDFNLLNQQQQDLDFKLTNQKEDYLAAFQTNFNLFAQQDIAFNQLPPLQHPFGKITEKTNVTTLLRANVNTVATENPMLTFSEKGAKRNAYLMGENIWKWRMESFVMKQSFDDFDLFVDKIIQFLSTNSAKKSLLVEHESFYNSGETIEIFAQFFNKNYELEENANLSILLNNKSTNKSKNFNFSKSATGYNVIFEGLEPGNYTFQVKENNSGQSYNSTFEVLDFDVEKQFVNPDKDRLQQLANQTNGQLIFPDKTDELIKKLLEENTYLPTEKEIIKQEPLINWKLLLLLLIASLSVEWFIRKYNGLL